jgi:hypothetical protein
VFSVFDACVIGEGETAFYTLIDRVRMGSRDASGIANVFVPQGRGISPVVVKYEDVAGLPSPDLTIGSGDQYLFPEKFVYYSPSRGCYWNKCTFCDYGLNFGTPTSPWRQRTVQQIVEDLRSISRYSRFIYFSVDVLAPAALERLALAIVDAKLDIRWAAEIRLEKKFDIMSCELLKRSGCLAVSFGFESASQRILDLLQKGTKIDNVNIIMSAFHSAGIAVQMMGFTGFPSETDEEAMETINFLERTAPLWTVAAIGEFQLTPGSIVAQNPSRFGIEMKRGVGENGFIRRSLGFTDLALPSESIEKVGRFQKKSINTAEFGRPFAGGIDTAHSLLFYELYGLKFPSQVVSSPVVSLSDHVLKLSGEIVAGIVFPDAASSAAASELRTAKANYDPDGLLSSRDYLKVLEGAPSETRAQLAQSVFVSTTGLIVHIDEGLGELLDHVQERDRCGAPTVRGLSNIDKLAVESALRVGILCRDSHLLT